jgi:hypothetical protein
VLYRLSHQESYIENFDVVQHCTGIFAYSDNGNNESKGYLFSIYSDYTTSYAYSTPLCRTHTRTHTCTHARTHAHRRHRPQSRRCHRHSSHLQHTGTPPSCLLHPHTRSRIHPAVAPCRTARICTPHACTRTQHTRRPRPLGGQMSGRQRRGPPRGSKATGWWR